MADPTMVLLCYVLGAIGIIVIITDAIEFYLKKKWLDQSEASSASGNLANLVDLR